VQLRLSKQSDVPLREQLSTQIVLAILSHDLKPGERLPSTRALGRRFRIHPNTVSAAYRDLSERGWVERRAGSGVYVRAFKAEPAPEARPALDELITDFLRLSRFAKVLQRIVL
jgi:GntR family transcriptional regulator